MGTHLRVFSYSMITNVQGLDGYQKSLCPCALDESSLSIGKVHRLTRVEDYSAKVFCLFTDATTDSERQRLYKKFVATDFVLSRHVIVAFCAKN